MFGTGYIDSIKEKFSEPRRVLQKDVDRLEKAAKRGDADAAYVLGLFFLRGNNSIKANLETAIKWVKFSSDLDYSMANYLLYKIYSSKYGEFSFVGKNDELALELLTKAAESGFSPAMRELGNCYKDGDLVEKDLEKAYSNYIGAFNCGEFSLAPQIADMILNGECDENNYALAVNLLEFAAMKENHVDSQNKLGELYLNGDHVEKDLEKAYYWFTSAAEQKSLPAIENLIAMHKNGLIDDASNEKLEQLMESAISLRSMLIFDLCEKYDDAFNKALKDAENGDVDAMAEVAYSYLYGKCVDQDHDKAFSWVNKAIEQGSSRGICVLADMYFNGLGVDEDIEKAEELYKKAADLGDGGGYYGLHSIYEEGLGSDDYEGKSIELLKKAAELGNSDAQCILGECYASGDGVEKDPKKAVDLLEKSVAQGNFLAKRELAIMYKSGDVVEKNLELALKILRN